MFIVVGLMRCQKTDVILGESGRLLSARFKIDVHIEIFSKRIMKTDSNDNFCRSDTIESLFEGWEGRRAAGPRAQP